MSFAGAVSSLRKSEGMDTQKSNAPEHSKLGSAIGKVRKKFKGKGRRKRQPYKLA